MKAEIRSEFAKVTHPGLRPSVAGRGLGVSAVGARGEAPGVGSGAKPQVLPPLPAWVDRGPRK